jgi:S-DNA-T family DNA segregation ATPase FtsK/SpoIIIE
LLGLYPDTGGLLTAVREQGALWERRPEHADFAHVRLGLGNVAAVGPVVLDGEGPPPGAIVESDLARTAEDLVDATAMVPETPVVLPLRELSSLAVVGDRSRARSLAGAWLAGLTASCAPTDLRVLMLLPPDAASDWDWTKWLPHLRDPLGGDGFGRATRAVWTDPGGFSAALRTIVEARLDQRRRAQEDSVWTRGPDGPAVAGEHLLVLIDGYDPLTLATAPHVATLLAGGASLAASTVLLVDEPSAVPSACGARIELLADGLCTYRAAGASGHIEQGVVADQLDTEAALRLARTLAPLHLADADASADLVDTVRLVELLGYESADQLDPVADVLTEAASLSTAQETLLAQRLEAMVFGEGAGAGASGTSQVDDPAVPEQEGNGRLGSTGTICWPPRSVSARTVRRWCSISRKPRSGAWARMAFSSAPPDRARASCCAHSSPGWPPGTIRDC